MARNGWKSVKVRLCDWLFLSILRDRQVLDYAATYFKLGPIKWIYEVARSTGVEGEAPKDGPGELRLQIGFENWTPRRTTGSKRERREGCS